MRDGGTLDGSMCWADVAVASQRAIRLFDTYVEPVLEAHGVARLGVTSVLFLLSIGRGPRRISEVAREEHFVGSNASYALAVLTKAGLVSSRPDVEDRRMRTVAVTERGRRLSQEIRRVSVGDEHAISTAMRSAALLASAASGPPVDVPGARREPPFVITLDDDLVFGPMLRDDAHRTEAHALDGVPAE